MHKLFHYEVDPILKEWLIDPGSTTKKFKKKGAKFSIRILFQGKGKISVDEAFSLGIQHGLWAWIRQVLIYADNQCVIYAKAIIPFNDFYQNTNPFIKLKNKSLGQWLFRDKEIKRSPLQFKKILIPENPWEKTENRYYTARTSLFTKGKNKLLLTEAFFDCEWFYGINRNSSKNLIAL